MSEEWPCCRWCDTPIYWAHGLPEPVEVHSGDIHACPERLRHLPPERRRAVELLLPRHAARRGKVS